MTTDLHSSLPPMPFALCKYLAAALKLSTPLPSCCALTSHHSLHLML